MSRPVNDTQLNIVFLGLAFMLFVLGVLSIAQTEEIKQAVIQTCKEK